LETLADGKEKENLKLFEVKDSEQTTSSGISNASPKSDLQPSITITNDASIALRMTVPEGTSAAGSSSGNIFGQSTSLAASSFGTAFGQPSTLGGTSTASATFGAKGSDSTRKASTGTFLNMKPPAGAFLDMKPPGSNPTPELKFGSTTSIKLPTPSQTATTRNTSPFGVFSSFQSGTGGFVKSKPLFLAPSTVNQETEVNNDKGGGDDGEIDGKMEDV